LEKKPPRQWVTRKEQQRRKPLKDKMEVPRRAKNGKARTAYSVYALHSSFLTSSETVPSDQKKSVEKSGKKDKGGVKRFYGGNLIGEKNQRDHGGKANKKKRMCWKEG